MALTINPATKEVSIPQADLTFASGTLYDFDTTQFMRDLNALLDDEDYIWMADAFSHNTEVTILGVTYARLIEMINGWNITFENTGSAYSVRFGGSNNNLFDLESGVLNATALVTVIGSNSAGLINTPDVTRVRKLIENRNQVNSATNKMEVYDDTGATIEFEADIYEDVAGSTPWDGNGDIIRRDKFTEV